MIVLLLLLVMVLCGMIWRGLYYSHQRLVLFELYCSIAILVLGVAPAAEYLLESRLPAGQVVNPMPIPALHYFGYALPLLLVICLGALNGFKPENPSDEPLLKRIAAQIQAQTYLPFLLLGLGIAAHLLLPYLPASLRQIGHFGSMLFYVGSVHLLFWPGHWSIKIAIFVGLAGILLYWTLGSTFFGDLLFWPLWLVLYAQLYYRWSVRVLLLTGLLLLGPVLFLFSFKYTYRAQIWDGQPHSFAEKFDEFKKAARFQTKQSWASPGWQKVLIRFNQGDHLAQVYAWVPSHEPYARGETLLTAAAAAAVPRLFWPNKPGAGGETIWYRFTGNKLLISSMNIGIGGEAYANFGPWISLLVLFGYVAGLRGAYHGLRNLAQRFYPCLWLWMPLVFYGLIDQENDFITQLNYGVKGVLFSLGMCWLLQKASNWNPLKAE